MHQSLHHAVYAAPVLPTPRASMYSCSLNISALSPSACVSVRCLDVAFAFANTRDTLFCSLKSENQNKKYINGKWCIVFLWWWSTMIQGVNSCRVKKKTLRTGLWPYTHPLHIPCSTPSLVRPHPFWPSLTNHWFALIHAPPVNYFQIPPQPQIFVNSLQSNTRSTMNSAPWLQTHFTHYSKFYLWEQRKETSQIIAVIPRLIPLPPPTAI